MTGRRDRAHRDSQSVGTGIDREEGEGLVRKRELQGGRRGKYALVKERD